MSPDAESGAGAAMGPEVASGVGPDGAPEWFGRALAEAPVDGWVEVDGLRVHYLEWGRREQPGLVLVHGGAAHAHWWSFLAPFLTSEYHVVALDMTGHGESDWRDEYPREAWSDEVMAVSEAAGMDCPIFVGHSLGGFVSTVTAARFGDRLAGAVVVDAPIGRPDPEHEEHRRGRAFRAEKRTYPDAETALSRFRLVPPDPLAEPFLVAHVARHSLTATDGGWQWKFDPHIFSTSALRSIRDVLPDITCRFALLRGERSFLLDEQAREMAYEALNRNVPIVDIPEAGHHVPLDQPLALVAALRAVLADWEHSIPRPLRRE